MYRGSEVMWRHSNSDLLSFENTGLQRRLYQLLRQHAWYCDMVLRSKIFQIEGKVIPDAEAAVHASFVQSEGWVTAYYKGREIMRWSSELETTMDITGRVVARFNYCR